jgi:AraC-like DNA-binding protein
MEESPDALVTLLEESLDVAYLFSGSVRTTIRHEPASLPYTVVGQSVEGPLWIQPDGGKPVRVPPGGGYILPEGTRCRIDARDERPRLYHRTHLRLRVLGNWGLFHFLETPCAVGTDEGGRIASLGFALGKTVTASPERVVTHVAERRRLCAEMLSLIVAVSRPRPEAIATGNLLAQLAPVFRFMQQHLSRPIFRDELAEVAGLSPSRFHAIFLAATGQSPMQYLTTLRLRQAQELLLSTRRAVNAISEAVGFRDAFHFSRTFKRHHGVSPQAYRRRSGGFFVMEA